MAREKCLLVDEMVELVEAGDVSLYAVWVAASQRWVVSLRSQAASVSAAHSDPETAQRMVLAGWEMIED